MTRHITFAYPGNLDLLTGGYAYDRKLIDGLRALGWTVDPMALGEGFPDPQSDVLDDAARKLSSLPDDHIVMIDGLAFAVMDDWASREAKRLQIIALVHHPLALEAGLHPDRQADLRARERRALTSTRAVVVTSPETARELAANFGVKADTITVALPGTAKATIAIGGGKPPHILSIGTLIHRKGHDVLIDALDQLRTLEWRCTIVGSKTLDPVHADFLARKIGNHGLGDRILLAGQRDDSRAELATADIFAMASRYEGYGMVFAEALSQGVSIVACKAGAVPDVVPPSAGILVEPDDVQAFADALRRLLLDEDYRCELASAALAAGSLLPDWADTARTVSDCIEKARHEQL